MGGSSSQLVESYPHVSDAKRAVIACRQTLGLLLSDPYPLSYDGRCDEHEYKLKQALAFSLDPRAARTLYDPASARRDKVEANEILKEKLRRHYSGR